MKVVHHSFVSERMTFVTLNFLLLLKVLGILSLGSLDNICQWKQIDYAFPTLQDRDYAIRNKLFIQNNVVPIDVDVDYKGE